MVARAIDANNQTVDAVLALVLLTGGVVGAQIGSRFAGRLPGEPLRGLLALLVLAVALRIIFGLVVPPDDVFTLSVGLVR